jgi:hypothetical protein
MHQPLDVLGDVVVGLARLERHLVWTPEEQVKNYDDQEEAERSPADGRAIGATAAVDTEASEQEGQNDDDDQKGEGFHGLHS